MGDVFIYGGLRDARPSNERDGVAFHGDLDPVDRAAAHAIALLPQLTIEIASTPEVLDSIFRLRWKHVVSAGWARPEDLPGGVEVDAYDIDAVHIAASHRKTVVGTCRLVFPRRDRLLPAEQEFGIEIEPRGQTAHCDRLLVESAYRSPAVTTALLARAWLVIRARGCQAIAGIASRDAMKLLRLMGFGVSILAGPRLYWGEARFAIRGDPQSRVASDRAAGHRT